MRLSHTQKRIGSIFTLLIVSFYLSISTVRAAIVPSVDFGSGLLIGTSVMGGGFATTILNLGAYFGSSVAIIMVISGGYKMLSSAGDAAKIRDGREQITNAGMGLALILLASTFIRLVFTAIGFSS